MRTLGLAFATIMAALSGAAAQSPYPIAGLTPDRRPEGAPTITSHVQDKAALEKYHYGVTPPYPTTLGAKDQGAWYTPFNRPGMTPPYDPRGWHASARAAK